MPEKPTQKEEEYFAKLEAERRRKHAEEAAAKAAAEERERQRALHFMRCPKCGAELREIEYASVRIDQCTSCEGVWLDKGELEAVSRKEPGFLGKLLGR